MLDTHNSLPPKSKVILYQSRLEYYILDRFHDNRYLRHMNNLSTLYSTKAIRASVLMCPVSSGKEKTKCDRIAPSHPLSWPCVSTCLHRLLRRELLRAFVTLDDSTPQRRTKSVVSYEPFIVFAPSSSGYTSSQNLEVLYIIRNVI